ncbi:hypothetical protein LTR28_006086 [Elasticomyces elasticus]|nr:hypothetical protein LTR28_006086 [Elasticomyces elasticus]
MNNIFDLEAIARELFEGEPQLGARHPAWRRDKASRMNEHVARLVRLQDSDNRPSVETAPTGSLSSGPAAPMMPQKHLPALRGNIARRASAPVLGAGKHDEPSTVVPRRNTIHGMTRLTENMQAQPVVMDHLSGLTEALRRFNETQNELRDLIQRIQRGEYPPDEDEVVPITHQAPTVEDAEDTEEESEWIEPFRCRHRG